jgi:hypothetical protein
MCKILTDDEIKIGTRVLLAKEEAEELGVNGTCIVDAAGN